MGAPGVTKASPDGHVPVPEVQRLRRLIVETAARAGEGHIASALSILDIVWVLYHYVLTIEPSRPDDEARDRFVLSKGHGSLALYVVLASKGFFPEETLRTFAKYDSPLGGHPDWHKIPGVEASTGSLGHGLPVALGMAMALRSRQSRSRVVTLVGDGECNEGSVWESLLIGAHHELSNVTCIVDFNHSTDRALSLGDLSAKLRAFGWETREVDGHDHAALGEALLSPASGPLAVVATTIKGHGCSRMEGDPAWHHRVPTSQELTEILAEMQ